MAIGSLLAVGCGSSGGNGTTGADGTDGATGFNGTTATDAVDGTDAADATDAVDGGPAADGMDGSAAGETIDVSNDAIGTGTPQTIAGPVQRAGALAGFGSTVAACNGNAVTLYPVANMGAGVDAALSAPCLALGAGADHVIAASTDGTLSWVGADGSVGATVQGPTGVHALTLMGDHLVIALGTDGLAIGPADLSAAPTTHAVAADARGATVSGSTLVVADGVAGFKAFTLGADGAPAAAGTQTIPPNTMAFGAAALSDGLVVGAVGGHGLVTLDVAGGALAQVGEVWTQGYPLDVEVLGDVVVASEWTQLRAYDLSDRTAPKLLAREALTGRSWGVAAADGAFYNLGLTTVTKVAVNPALDVPELHLPRKLIQTEIGPESDSGAAGILIFNTGRADLVLSNIQLDDRITLLGIDEPTITVAADDVAFLEASIAGNQSGAMQITFDTNDVDHPSVTMTIDVNPQLLQIGDAAPDVTVPTLSGDVVRLSDFKGEVVHMKLFNSQ